MEAWAPILAAPFVGSFLGVLIRRIPSGQPMAWARSRCEACGHVLGPRDLVPFLSFAVLHGRCRHCRAPIAPFHWQVEAAALVVAVWAVLASPWDGDVWPHCVLGWALLALAWIDWEHFRLPDVLTLPLLLGGLLEGWWLDPDMAPDRALAAGAGYLSFRGVAWGYRLLRGREGLGQGDAKLLAAGGAWVGLAALPLVVTGAALAGIIWAVAARRGREPGGLVPFGPFLALGIWVTRLHGAALG